MSVQDALFKLSKGVSEGTYGLLNKGQRLLLQNLSLQSPSMFELVIYPKSRPSRLQFLEHKESAAFYGGAALDTAIARLAVQRISVPFNKLTYDKKSMFGEYDVSNGQGGLTGIEPLQKVSITFIETELNIVIRYLNYWLNSI